MATSKSVSLTLRNDKHSKSYFAELVEAKGGWVVNFSYGAIGSAQKPGTKTATPVEFDKALKIYEKLVAEKTGKPCDCCGAVYVGPASDTHTPAPAVTLMTKQEHPGFNPELLEPTDDAGALRYINDDRYGAERKFDGERLSISYVQDEVIGYNRLGKVVPAPESLVKKITFLMDWRSESTLQIDGEWVHDEYVAYDLLILGGDVKHLPMETRHKMLTELLATTGIKVADLVTGTKMKAALVIWEKEHRGEGIVFKKLSAPYMPGKRGVNVKYKFWESATVRVCAKKKNAEKHSFGVEALKHCDYCVANFDAIGNRQCPIHGNGPWVYCGSVTCKGALPAIGTYREVAYLYVGAGGGLFQPEDLGARTDVTDADCGYNKLKHKQDAEHRTV